jgi:hypothetical protein
MNIFHAFTRLNKPLKYLFIVESIYIIYEIAQSSNPRSAIVFYMGILLTSISLPSNMILYLLYGYAVIFFGLPDFGDPDKEFFARFIFFQVPFLFNFLAFDWLRRHGNDSPK